jgi:hypothetical protein
MGRSPPRSFDRMQRDRPLPWLAGLASRPLRRVPFCLTRDACKHCSCLAAHPASCAPLQIASAIVHAMRASQSGRRHVHRVLSGLPSMRHHLKEWTEANIQLGREMASLGIRAPVAAVRGLHPRQWAFPHWHGHL